MAEVEKKEIKMSTASKTRKSLGKLQQMKNKGERIVQVCPAELGPVFAMAAEMAGADAMRIPSMLNMRNGNTIEEELITCTCTIKKFREYVQIIHINFVVPTAIYTNKDLCMDYVPMWIKNGADSILPMGVTNDMLKWMSDNYIPTYGHIGAISGWQTNAIGYKRCGKTAEEAFRIFKWGYEYQENGMGCMTIELTPMEVSQAIAEKLRVPVISIAAGAPCDGCEQVDMDTFNMMPSPASHAKGYADLVPFLVGAYAGWVNDVRTKAYPEEKNGYHMDPEELAKFNELMANF